MPVFPGGTAVSALEVYQWQALDGCHGGSPHVHLACTEAYVVVGGRGELHTLTPAGSAVASLSEGTVAWFAPGTVHRAVNVDHLRVVVVMENAGLPEEGDTVMTFPSEVLGDPERYRAEAALDPHDLEASARRRRDLAVAGYLQLAERVEQGDSRALTDFYESAGKLVRYMVPSWRKRVERGPAAAVTGTLCQLDRLAAGELVYLQEAAVEVRTPAESSLRYGMCGRLRTYDLSG